MSLLKNLKSGAEKLSQEILTLYFAARDPRTPWYARLLVVCVVAYALSPIDLIPDPIPILGYLDDLVLLPLGIYAALKLIPQPVIEECRRKVTETPLVLRRSRAAAGIIIVVWLATGLFLAKLLLGFFASE